MNRDQQRSLHEDALATLERLKLKHPDLEQELEQAHGYAVFPSLGRASLVLGGTFGRGAVFEKGKCVGFASLTQITIGVQVGGQTLSELVFFPDREAFELFQGGKSAFAANVSAGIIKAAATGTTDPGPFVAHAYSRGGMVLEASLGGQKLSFMPPGGEKSKEKTDKKRGSERGGRRLERRFRDGGERPSLGSMRPPPFVAAGLSALALVAARALKTQAALRSGQSY